MGCRARARHGSGRRRLYGVESQERAYHLEPEVIARAGVLEG